MSLLANLPKTFNHYAVTYGTKTAGGINPTYPSVTNQNIPCHLFQSGEPVIDEYGMRKMKDSQTVFYTYPISVAADDKIVIDSVDYRVIKAKEMFDGSGQIRFYRLDVTEMR